MNALSFICILIAAGLCGFLIYAGQALLAAAQKPKHQHAWETDRVIHVWDSDNASRPMADLYVLRCTGCGDIRKRKVKA